LDPASTSPLAPRKAGPFFRGAIECGMKKEELEDLLGTEQDELDLGPIEEHLQALASETRLPLVSLRLCAIRIEESAPALRAVLQRAADGESLTDDEEMLLFRGLYVLGGTRDKQSYPLLLRLLRRSAYELHDLLGDFITEDLARIVAGMFDGTSEPLFELIRDPTIDQYVRNALLGALTFLTWEGLIQQRAMEDFLVKFPEDCAPEHEDEAWAGWANAISLLGLRHLAPLAYRAFDEGRVPDWVLDRSEFEEDLVDAEQRPDDPERFQSANLGYIEDIAETLGGNDVFEDDDDFSEGPDDFSEDDVPFADQPPFKASAWMPSEPVRNPMRHVGRNDPCPCGSGKKAKKCCLARQD